MRTVWPKPWRMPMRGVIHRDLKPANILLSRTPARHDIGSDVPVGSGAPDGYVPKITDFGLAKRADGDGGQTVAGQIMGTPSYMPPEQACGNASQVAETADIYSLGAILFAMLTGRPPFVGESQLDVLIQVIEQDAISPRELDPKIPRDLNTICLKCMAREPGRRYESRSAGRRSGAVPLPRADPGQAFGLDGTVGSLGPQPSGVGGDLDGVGRVLSDAPGLPVAVASARRRGCIPLDGHGIGGGLGGGRLGCFSVWRCAPAWPRASCTVGRAWMCCCSRAGWPLPMDRPVP